VKVQVYQSTKPIEMKIQHNVSKCDLEYPDAIWWRHSKSERFIVRFWRNLVWRSI